MKKMTCLRKTRFFLGIFFTSVLIISCDLELEPRGFTRIDEKLNDVINIESSLVNVYSNLRSSNYYGRDMLALADALADVTIATQNSGRFVGENKNFPNAHFSAGFWEVAYFSIDELNRVLNQISIGVEGATEDQLDKWEGEAKFLRALFLFDLARVYTYIPTAILQEGIVDQGGIPMPLSPKYDLDEIYFNQEPRVTIDENYDQIIRDLNDAIELLEDSNRPVPQFASMAAAQALLSRVALYMGDWETVVAASTAAFTSSVGQFTDGVNYTSGWRSPIHPESIFEVRFHDQSESLGINSSIQSAFTTLVDLAEKNRLGGWGDLVPSPIVLEFFGLRPRQIGNPASNNNNWDVNRNRDIRATLYTTGSGARLGGRQIECTKFLGKNNFSYGDNIPVIRKSEMLLNRMEANFHLGNIEDALSDYMLFKTSRGLEATQVSGEAFLEDVLNERFKEFAFEGHRFFDLKRYGKDIDKRSYLGEEGLIPFSDFRILAPIPASVVQRNPNLNQNRGY